MKIVDSFTNENSKPNKSFTICECGKFLIFDKILDKIIENNEEFFRCCNCNKEFIINE